jgi:predicted amidohydrolase YtcJ
VKADLVLIACKILTMNPLQPYAEAIAIKNDRIVRVGEKKEIISLIGNQTNVIELKEATIVPGLIDTHLHLADFGRFLTWLDLNGVESIKEIKKIIRIRVQKIPVGKWILGQGLNQTRFREKRSLSIQDLNDAAPSHPLLIYHQSGSFCLVNRKALDLAGVTEKTDSPAGGTIEYDVKTGELTGVLRGNAMNLIWKMVPDLDEEEVLDATRLACEKTVEAGLTSVHWIVSSWSEIQIIQKLRAENKLPIRVYIIYPTEILDQTRSLRLQKNFDDEWTHIGGVKLFADGYLAARTASLNKAYNDDPETKGQLLYTPEAFDALVSKLHKAHLRLVIHAMGDHAIDMVLTAIEKNLKELPRKDHRYRIEHASALNNELIRRIKKLGIIIAVQPLTIVSEFTSWSAIDRLGAERARWLYPLKTLIKEGVLVSGGSDCPMEKINPLLGIHAVVTRQFFPEEQITIDDALRMYTVNAAYASFEEKTKGSIEEGKLADLTILSHDPQTTPPNQIKDIKVKLTIVGGKIVYTSKDFLTVTNLKQVF